MSFTLTTWNALADRLVAEQDLTHVDTEVLRTGERRAHSVAVVRALLASSSTAAR